MGSHGPTAEDSAADIHVLVTGFGNFHGHAANPSWLITASLPSTLPSPSSGTRTIHIHTSPGPIEVSYKTVRGTVPALNFSPELSSKPKFDIIVHLGMATTRNFYALECQAHRDGYDKEDVNGKTLKDDTFWKEEYGAPEVLKTKFDCEQVLQRWKKGLTDEDVRLSEDAGRYLCEFIYYTGMVEYWRRNQEGDIPVVFLHVPPQFEEEDITRGKRITLGLIQALVESKAVN